MMRRLDILGPFKWPSLALIAAPLLAYPFWLPASAPAERCGQVSVGGQAFDVYSTASATEVILRPVRPPARASASLDVGLPVRFDNGGMVIEVAALQYARLRCPAER